MDIKIILIWPPIEIADNELFRKQNAYYNAKGHQIGKQIAFFIAFLLNLRRFLRAYLRRVKNPDEMILITLLNLNQVDYGHAKKFKV